MQQYELLALVQQEIQNSGCDIKAEAQLLQAQQKGMLPDDFLVSCDQLFRREYSKDIVSVEVTDEMKRSVLNLHLSRSGWYDHLPEGLFFQQPLHSNRLITLADMTRDYKANKKKEAEMRSFLLPFEHDFFLQRMEVEAEENTLLHGLQSGLLNDYFNRFWNLPSTIPKAFVGQLILLLPYVHKIAGNFDLTAQCLHQLLREQVNINHSHSHINNAETVSPPPVLGEARLGLDMISGSEFWEGDPAIEIKVGPLMYSQIADYLPGGERHVLMETFSQFFIPAGIDINISVSLPIEKMNMELAKDNEPVLGYSSVLGG